MATTKTKRPRRVVVMATAELLHKQVSSLWLELPTGTVFKKEMQAIMADTEALVLQIKNTLEPTDSDDDNEIS